MIYNHDRVAVWDWGGDESLCPECGHSLIAKRGDIVVWHWAHKPVTGGKSCICPHKESIWHLTGWVCSTYSTEATGAAA